MKIINKTKGTVRKELGSLENGTVFKFDKSADSFFIKVGNVNEEFDSRCFNLNKNKTEIFLSSVEVITFDAEIVILEELK